MITQTTYDRTKTKIGWLHVGYGAFHRAHQAVYVDDYMEATGDLNWGIAAANLRAQDVEAFEAAQVPDGYLLKTMSPEGHQHMRLVRPHLSFHNWSAMDLIGNGDVDVVSVTVTESGYYLNDDLSLNKNDPVIRSDLMGLEPNSIYFFLAVALSRREVRVQKPLTILCCDNIRSNGKMLRRNLLDFMRSMDPARLEGTAEWVEENVSFPCSMVDRITPRTSSPQSTKWNSNGQRNHRASDQGLWRHAGDPWRGPGYRGWRVRGLCWPVRLWQIHLAADDRWARGRQRMAGLPN